MPASCEASTVPNSSSLRLGLDPLDAGARRSTILTSQVPIDKWHEATAILDRLDTALASTDPMGVWLATGAL